MMWVSCGVSCPSWLCVHSELVCGASRGVSGTASSHYSFCGSTHALCCSSLILHWCTAPEHLEGASPATNMDSMAWSVKLKPVHVTL